MQVQNQKEKINLSKQATVGNQMQEGNNCGAQSHTFVFLRGRNFQNFGNESTKIIN